MLVCTSIRGCSSQVRKHVTGNLGAHTPTVRASILLILSDYEAAGESNDIAAVSATFDAVIPKLSCDDGMHEHSGL